MGHNPRSHKEPAMTEQKEVDTSVLRLYMWDGKGISLKVDSSTSYMKSQLSNGYHFLSQRTLEEEGKMVKKLPEIQETPVRFLGQEDPLEKE